MYTAKYNDGIVSNINKNGTSFKPYVS